MTSSLSILGLYRWDPQIFDKMALPDGVDRSLLVNNLVFELGCLEVLYPSAPFMADMVELWSNKELPTWERLYSAMKIEYNPIENYDRQEEWTDEKDETRESSVSDSTILDGQTQNSGSVTHAVQNMTTDREVTGYNSNSLVPQARDVEHGSTVDTDATRQDVDSKTTRTGEGTEDIDGTTTHKGRVHGNIGVTTSQQMLQSELELVPQLNIINHIISSFKTRFCILVY